MTTINRSQSILRRKEMNKRKTTTVTIFHSSWLRLNHMKNVGESMASVVDRLLKEYEKSDSKNARN